jgi:hypothetical protein
MKPVPTAKTTQSARHRRCEKGVDCDPIVAKTVPYKVLMCLIECLVQKGAELMLKAIVTGVLLPAAALLIAPPANGAPSGNTWAAIAYSTTTGKARLETNASSQLEAQNDAVSACNRLSGDNSCKVVAYSDHCVSLATDPDPNNNAGYSGGHGDTLAAADADAMSGADSDWTIEGHGCNTA